MIHFKIIPLKLRFVKYFFSIFHFLFIFFRACSQFRKNKNIIRPSDLCISKKSSGELFSQKIIDNFRVMCYNLPATQLNSWIEESSHFYGGKSACSFSCAFLSLTIIVSQQSELHFYGCAASAAHFLSTKTVGSRYTVVGFDFKKQKGTK